MLAITAKRSDFNPRSREGSDVKEPFEYGCIVQFQSTLPRRERLNHPPSFILCTDFNPRSREGSDDKLYASAGQFEISIHAPAKGATYSIIRKV